jgi:ATP synthase protein I
MSLSGYQSLAVASNFAVILASCVLVGIFGGSFLDARLGTSPIFLVLGSVLGTVAGVWSMYKTSAMLIARFERKNRGKNSTEQ